MTKSCGDWSNLNRERAEEEKRGTIRWLRPEYQNPDGVQAASTTRGALPIEPESPEASPAVAGAKRPWPKTLPEQAQAVRAVLAEQAIGLTPEQLARLFLCANTQRVTDMLNTLVSLGQCVRWRGIVTSVLDQVHADLVRLRQSGLPENLPEPAGQSLWLLPTLS